jgi:hypothetical protein
MALLGSLIFERKNLRMSEFTKERIGKKRLTFFSMLISQVEPGWPELF